MVKIFIYSPPDRLYYSAVNQARQNEWISKLKLKQKFLLSFILLTIFSYSILYSIVYMNYFNVIIKQRELSTGQLLAAMEISLDVFYNELFTLSNALSINPLVSSLIFETIEAGPEVADDIVRKLEYKLANRPYMQGIRLYKGDQVYMSIYQNHKLLNTELDRTGWEINNPHNEKMMFIPTYKKSYKKVDTNNQVNTDYQYDERIFSFVRVIEDMYDNEVASIVIDMQESYFHALYDNMKLTEHCFNIILSPSGFVISATDKSSIGTNHYDDLFQLMSEERGGFIQEFNGSNNLVVYDTYKRYGWKLVSCIPLNDMHLFKKTFNQIILAFLLVFIMANIVLSLMVSRVLNKPLKKILDAITQIREGDFNISIDYQNKDEIGIIANNLKNMAGNIDSLIKENYVIKLREQEAEIRSLQAQINPHFLYNTLDTISWKVLLMGGDDISRVINALGEILRYNIRQSTKIVSLKEELQQIENYLFIQKVRYEDRFRIEYDIEEKSLGMQIHKLIIQPIIENAIQHGLEDKQNGGVLHISTEIRGDDLRICIFDNGKGIQEERISRILRSSIPEHPYERNNHIGIYNVHKRIQHYYGQKYGITIESAVGYFTKVIITIPAIELMTNKELQIEASTDR